MSLYVLFKKELREIVRSKKLLILIILFAFIAVSSPIIAKLLPVILKSVPATPGLTISLPDPTYKDAIDQLIKNLSQIGIIVIIIMFAGAITDEKSKKTLEILLTKPISRSQFVLAKFLSSIFAAKVIFLLSMVVFYLYTISILGSFSVLSFLWLTIFLLIYMAVALSITLFYSAIARNSIISIALSFSTIIVMSIVLGYIKQIAKYAPNYITGHYTELMQSRHLTDFLPSAITSLVLIALLAIASMYLFSRQEIER